MQRLGLWGEGAAFRSFEVFLETVQKKGLGLLTFYIFSYSIHLLILVMPMHNLFT